MPPGLAQQLRDIHEPAVPGFWPLTISWWILFSFILVMVVILFVWYLWHQRRLAPYKRIRKLAKELTQQRENGTIDALKYATRVNLLYKELLLDVEDRTESTTAFGASWQDLLAARFDNQGFTIGPGRCLGIARFSGTSFSDEGLVGLVQSTLLRVKPRTEHSHA